jgi:hypothetical protein
MTGVHIKRGNLDTMDTEEKKYLNGEISLEKN